ncbi:MAG TPA: hypothetical protein VIV60_26585 [Polyangiaceae bacterium]
MTTTTKSPKTASIRQRNQGNPCYGCVVVLEPGAAWPSKEFARMPHRDGVIVLSRSEHEMNRNFLRRLAFHCSLLAASGVVFKTAIIACRASVNRVPTIATEIKALLFSDHMGEVIFAGSS